MTFEAASSTAKKNCKPCPPNTHTQGPAHLSECSPHSGMLQPLPPSFPSNRPQTLRPPPQACCHPGSLALALPACEPSSQIFEGFLLQDSRSLLSVTSQRGLSWPPLSGCPSHPTVTPSYLSVFPSYTEICACFLLILCLCPEVSCDSLPGLRTVPDT